MLPVPDLFYSSFCIPCDRLAHSVRGCNNPRLFKRMAVACGMHVAALARGCPAVVGVADGVMRKTPARRVAAGAAVAAFRLRWRLPLVPAETRAPAFLERSDL